VIENPGGKNVYPNRFTEGENTKSAYADGKFSWKIPRSSLPIAIHLYRHDDKEDKKEHKRGDESGGHLSLEAS
jgi:hypothetical protein